MASVMGWDLGGANLKLARIEAGRVVHVAQIPCPIRQDVSKFDAALEEALTALPAGATHAVTMTGELSDVFANRAEGVAYLVDMMRNATGGEALFYGGQVGLSRLHPRGRTGVRRGLGQLACERRAGRPDAARRVVDRCRHDHHGPYSAQRRSGGGALLRRRRAACRGRVRLYRRRAHAGDGGGADRARSRAACSASPPSASPPWPTSGGCWASFQTMPTPTRPPTWRARARSERGTACPHAGPRRERGGSARLRRSRAAFRRLPACRDRGRRRARFLRARRSRPTRR